MVEVARGEVVWREEVLRERQETKGPSSSVLLDSPKKSPEVLQHSSICEVLRQVGIASVLSPAGGVCS